MSARTPWILSLVCAFALGLAACGGGSSDGLLTVDPDPAEPDPVEADPEINATRPAHNEKGVDEAIEITIEFSIDIEPSADHEGYFKVFNPAGDVDGVWSLDATQRRLTFVPDDKLPLDTRHDVEMAPGLPYADGTQRSDPFAFGFEVRVAAFEDAGYLEQTTDPARSAYLAAHDNGRTMALYVADESAGGRKIYSARYKPAGADFGAETELYRDNLSNVASKCIAINRHGDAVFAWRRDLPAGDYGYLKVYDRQSQTWGSQKFFQTNADREMGNPSVVIDDLGNMGRERRDHRRRVRRCSAVSRGRHLRAGAVLRRRDPQPEQLVPGRQRTRGRRHHVGPV